MQGRRPAGSACPARSELDSDRIGRIDQEDLALAARDARALVHRHTPGAPGGSSLIGSALVTYHKIIRQLAKE